MYKHNNSPNGEKPSCLHATLAFELSQELELIVPQSPFTHTSTLPSSADDPPTNLIEFSSQAAINDSTRIKKVGIEQTLLCQECWDCFIACNKNLQVANYLYCDYIYTSILLASLF